MVTPGLEELPRTRYGIQPGIRPPRTSGKVRGVVHAYEPGGGLEIWHCDHDHAPGVRDCQQLTPGQITAAQECAETWLLEQMITGVRPTLPIVRED